MPKSKCIKNLNVYAIQEGHLMLDCGNGIFLKRSVFVFPYLCSTFFTDILTKEKGIVSVSSWKFFFFFLIKVSSWKLMWDRYPILYVNGQWSKWPSVCIKCFHILSVFVFQENKSQWVLFTVNHTQSQWVINLNGWPRVNYG